MKRFIESQQRDYKVALAEIENGKKRSHWMWYIFPQIRGLGFSETSQYYAIKNLDDAKEYLAHPILGSRLVKICKALLQIDHNDANKIFGTPDDLKLRSCMTLFTSIEHTDPVFELVLKKFFNGKKDSQTIRILEGK